MSRWRRLLRRLRHPWRDDDLAYFLWRCETYARDAAEWDEWQRLEHLDRDLTFPERLDLEMYRMKSDMKRDYHRQLWGDGAPKKMTGLQMIQQQEPLA